MRFQLPRQHKLMEVWHRSLPPPFLRCLIAPVRPLFDSRLSNTTKQSISAHQVYKSQKSVEMSVWLWICVAYTWNEARQKKKKRARSLQFRTSSSESIKKRQQDTSEKKMPFTVRRLTLASRSFFNKLKASQKLIQMYRDIQKSRRQNSTTAISR